MESSKDPVGIANKLKTNFLDYLDTAFTIKNKGLVEERRTELLDSNCFWQEPLIEIAQNYKPSGKKLEDLQETFTSHGFSESQFKAVNELLTDGLLPYELYEHQVEMLRSYLSGKNAVITSGTGSGKTEAFLLPFLSQLIKESESWAKPNPEPQNLKNWWSDDSVRASTMNTTNSYRVPQREHEKRDAAVRGMIIYPMNALVEDQMSRIRKILDSDSARQWFKNNRENNRIYFGRYTGDSVPTGYEYNPYDNKKDRNKIDSLRDHFLRVETAQKEISNLPSPQKEESRFLFENCNGSEMISRWDMQSHPPDILITNFSMLSYMMMRDVENDIFEKTKEWLEKEGNVFHLIVDELHLYRGTPGTEIAYLIRLLKLRLGIENKPEKFKIIAASASLESAQDDNSFLKEFFGESEDSFEKITGTLSELKESQKNLQLEPYKTIGEEIDRNNSWTDIKTILENKLSEKASFFLERDKDFLKSQIYKVFFDQKQNKSLVKRFSEVANLVFEGSNQQEKEKALRGLFFFLDQDEFDDFELPRFKIHYFYRNFEGLWACVKPNYFSKKNRQKGEKFFNKERTVGELFTDQTHSLYTDDYKNLELLYCDTCGDVFFGGFKTISFDKQVLLSNDPDLESAPQISLERFWERRDLRKYGVFWPSSREIKGKAKDKFSQPFLNASGSSAKCQWTKKFLNCKNGEVLDEDEVPTGKINDFTEGYIFDLTDPTASNDEEKLIAALPRCCPSCGEEKRIQQRRKSPIRSFRTGFSKVSQLYTKGLFDCLPEDNRKTVVFSDSREDAAGISNGIERSHFDDVIRSLVFKQISELPKLLTDTKIQKQYKAEYEKLKPLEETLEAYKAISNPTPQTVKDIEDYEKTLSSFKGKDFQMKILLGKTAISENGTIFDSLKKLGMNPAGSSIKYQSISNNESWQKVFDFHGNNTFRDNLPADKENFKNAIITKTKYLVGTSLLNRSYFSFESSGLGYPIFPYPFSKEYDIDEKTKDFFDSLKIKDSVKQNILSSSLRLLGDQYRFKDPDPEFPFTDIQDLDRAKKSLGLLKDYLERVSKKHSLDSNELFETIYNIFRNLQMSNFLILDAEHFLLNLSNEDDLVWKCTHCSKEHLHDSAGICIRCGEDLPTNPSQTVKDVMNHHFYAQQARKGENIYRIHSEELTGQTDDQAQRQRHFRNIILDDECKETDEIEVLSVTTTMEVGIDIGALKSVMMANMPPLRFNYQQRAGRSGRRLDRFSYVLTLCRSRTHDVHYYNNPEEITNEKAPDPFLTMNVYDIPKRLMAKECLRRFFVDKFQAQNSSQVHGEFDDTNSWHKYEADAKVWFENSDEVDDIAIGLSKFSPEDEDFESKLREYIRDTSTKDGLFLKIKESLQRSNKDYLSELLAETAILPMFGMPTRSRNLYHDPFALKKIDRDIELAINEFSPGSIKTKDKKLYEVIGFTAEIPEPINSLKPYENRNALVKNKMSDENPLGEITYIKSCKSCGKLDEVIESDLNAENLKCAEENGGCGFSNPDDEDVQKISVFKAASPLAYRTDLSRGLDADENNEFNLTSSSLTVANSSPSKFKVVRNTFLSSSDQAEVYRISDNGGNLFSGRLYKTKHQERSINNQVFSLKNQWIEDRFSKGYDPDPESESEKIALLSKKITDNVSFSPNKTPNGILLNHSDFKATYKLQNTVIKSAFYSAAFILRKMLAKDLDIDPIELEISRLQLFSQSPLDPQTGKFSLSDELANGSGFSSWIYETGFNNAINEIYSLDQSKNSILSGLLDQSHVQNCDSSGYCCMHDFKNMNFHPILDWRLGLNVLYHFAVEDFSSGLTNASSETSLPFMDFCPTHPETHKKVEDFCSSIEEIEFAPLGQLPGFKTDYFRAVLVHPLWDLSGGSEDKLTATQLDDSVVVEASIEENDLEIKYFDLFNLSRRPMTTIAALFDDD